MNLDTKPDENEADGPDLPSGAEETRVDPALASIVGEAKARWVPAPKRMDHATEAERKLLARIDAFEKREGSSGPRRAGLGGDARFWRPVALMTAVAAGFVFFARPQAEVPSAGMDRGVDPRVSPASLGTPSVSGGHGDTPRPTAPAELAAVTGGGELRVDEVGVRVRAVSLRDAQKVEARGGDAVFTAPGRASWLLENGTEVSTVRAGTHGGAIILALQVGAVEAQVTPVPGGEAFAVDVEGVRVAVHGTHLRVARAERSGDRVVVDLTEGTILIGTPPKTGATVSSVQIIAPAHVEFSVSDVARTLTMDHAPSHVRTAVDPLSLMEGAPSESMSASPSTLNPTEEPTPARPSVLPTAAGPRAPSAAAPKTPTESEMIQGRVRACADKLMPAGSGTATISSVFTVKVKADGMPESANFRPPVQPELQSCVTDGLWTTHWTEAGDHRFPIEIHR